MKNFLIGLVILFGMCSMSLAVDQADLQVINPSSEYSDGWWVGLFYKDPNGNTYKYLYEDATTIYITPFEFGELITE